MNTQQRKRLVLRAYLSFNAGQVSAWLVLGHITAFGIIALGLSTLGLGWVYSRYRIRYGYEYHPFDCPRPHLMRDYDYVCPDCGMEISDK